MIQDQQKRETEIKDRLEALENLIRTEDTEEEERILLEELDSLWRDEEKMWRQRSRIQWLAEGDRNTKFFHSTTVLRQHFNRIVGLKNERGTWIKRPLDLANHIKGFYQNLFSGRSMDFDGHLLQGFPQLVSQEMNDILCRPVTNGEIKQAVFSLGPHKSPGPDGFSGQFYRNYWGSIEDNFCEEVESFFMESSLPSGWNDTHIALIPKISSPEMISQFRPISCCNFKYKVISKIMASRLKPIIPELVSDMQAAFTGGRVIQDNIIIVHEVLHHLKNRRQGKKYDMMLKMDMRKAYDLVDWECLTSLLQAYGFNQTWCDWIMECVRTVRFSILINGGPKEFFTPSRGIRQGDPISPFLFILMANALSFLLDKETSQGAIHGLKLKPSCPRLSHCLFADDTVNFGEASLEEATKIMSIINGYSYITGQEVNLEKSSIFFSKNTPDSLRTQIAAHIGFPPTITHD
ncbi:unnamed protein product [Linum trigynum]|uniref:Reverse transcriptase domain-containing protein n=1 Tax=Linum trigynum TaxID=586398 RepID=A0AAV2CXT5_9ROSI